MLNLDIRNLTKARIDRDLFLSAAKAVLKRLDWDNARNKKTEISLVIVGNKRMRELNRRYRGKDKVTDVLSFENESDDFIEVPDNKKRLGEIVICHPYAKKESERLGYTLSKELTLLFVHGILHLAGYDHEKSTKDKEFMKCMEDKILSLLSLSK